MDYAEQQVDHPCQQEWHPLASMVDNRHIERLTKEFMTRRHPAGCMQPTAVYASWSP